ncbi:hypothetical protein DSO57_1003304 [Entomophthora muscae]|uniref:Uncharacterized protein n=1 Tax=Entomophthora muscae TaxID=34485 RepID=A0ACC2T887_9FUNG|nr:hypothetical protein DSO57_1003304 [Entomophthora muscae]
MNHLIFLAALTACLRIGSHQQQYQPHEPFNNPSNKYFYKEPEQLDSSDQYSWPALVLPQSTQSIAFYTMVYYVLKYFAGIFGQFNVHTKEFQWVKTVYPIITALTGLQVANLGLYLARILPQLLVPLGLSAPVLLPAEPSGPQTKLFCPPGVPFSPVHFIKYPSNLAYSEFDLGNIILKDLLARTRVPEHFNRETTCYNIQLQLLRNKFNYLPSCCHSSFHNAWYYPS